MDQPTFDFPDWSHSSLKQAVMRFKKPTVLILCSTTEEILPRYFRNLIRDFEGRVHFEILRNDTISGRARRKSARTIPTLFLFKDGILFDNVSQALREKELRLRLDALIKV